MSVALAIRGLVVRNGNQSLVGGVDLSVSAGEFVALVGESGAGKSLTAWFALGGVPPGLDVEYEELRINELRVHSFENREVRKMLRDHVGVVTQNPIQSLDPQIRIGTQLKRIVGANVDLVQLLSSVELEQPDTVLGAYPSELSGGMAQRVLIAAAIGKPDLRLLIADEPTTGLDVIVQRKILDLLFRKCGELGCGMLLVTHDLRVVSNYCDRVVLLRNGVVEELTDASTFFESPSSEYGRYVLEVSQ